MLRVLTILPALLLAHMLFRVAHCEVSVSFSFIPSRSKMLLKIGGDTVEQRLHLERCRQSSVSESCIFAIDDDINQESWSNECAMTTADMKPWWEARLEDPSYVSKVQIFNLNMIAERGVDALTDFQLLVGDHICIKYRSYSSFSNKTFACDTFGDHVRIQSHIDHAVLALCEVAVYGKIVNVSWQDRGKTSLKISKCMQSSADGANRCHLAMDHALGQKSQAGNCAKTAGGEMMAWWEALLEEPALVRTVKIHNTVDCCQDQLTSFEISVNGQLCYKFDQDKKFSVDEFSGCGRFGSRVRITSMKNEMALILCEVAIFGYPVVYHSFSNNKYIGCYEERKRNRDLENLAAIHHMTVEKCERMCRRRKKPYFGLQQGKQCWCSERYGLYGKASEDACWMQCDSKVSQMCGAKLRNSVFEINEMLLTRQ